MIRTGRFIMFAVPLALLACGAAGASPAAEATEAVQHDAIRTFEFVYASAPYPQSHASTVVQTRTGAIAAAWFGGTHESNPDVEIWFAKRSATGWDTPVSVANGIQPDGSRMPTWNPVLFQDPAGPLYLFYKAGPSPARWWGMVVTSDDDGRTWNKPRRLPDGILGPIKNKPVVLPDGTWLSPSSIEVEGAGWSLHFERSDDRGKTWTATPPVDPGSRFDAIQPSILVTHDGRLQALARTRQGVVVSTWSEDGGKSWSRLMPIDLPNPNSGTDAITLRDGRQLIVYNHSAHRPETSGNGVRYPINIALSDDGISWRSVLTLESEPIPSGYAYPAVIQSADGLVHITYTWDRRRIRHVVLDPARL